MALTAAALLAGCVSAPVIPPELRYAEPATGEPSATLIGSEQPVKVLFDDYTAFVLNIDGKRVMAGRKGWKAPIKITAGKHRITTEFNHGVFVARAEIEFEAAGGAAYQVLFNSDGHGLGSPRKCDFWIVDQATKKSVSAIVPASVGGGSEGGYVPIFIPVR